MNRTFTPALDAGVLARLQSYAAHFAADFQGTRQRAWCAVYLAGLLQDGERKSIEPLSRRVALPAAQAGTSDPDQALQQFVSASAWDERALGRRYRELLGETFTDAAGVFVLGRHELSEGGHPLRARAASGLRCPGQEGQLPSRRLGALRGHQGPPAAGDAPVLARRVAAGPRATGWSRGAGRGARALTKGQIALELLDMVRAEGALSGRMVVADAGYGVSGGLRAGLSARGLHYLVGVTEEMVVFAQEPRWEPPAAGGRGRPRRHPRLDPDSARPFCLRELAAQTPRHQVTWRQGTKGPMRGRFAWRRVWPAHGWATGECAHEPPLWLLVEEQADGAIKYAFSNLPAATSRLAAMPLSNRS